MNRNIFVGLIVLLILLIVFNYKFYMKTSNEVIRESRNLSNLESKMKEINYLKSKYKINLNNYKKFCSIKDIGSKYIVECTNLNKEAFLRIENLFRKSKLYKFNIIKNNKVNVKAEILKWKNF